MFQDTSSRLFAPMMAWRIFCATLGYIFLSAEINFKLTVK